MRDSPPIYLHNSLTGKKEKFIPKHKNNIRMYVCGPTVYAPPHIGNMRPVVVFDVLYRLLRWKYGAEHVTYVRNITDVDDKIIEAARERSVDTSTLTYAVETNFNEQCKELGALPPDETPHATDYIPQMQDLVKRLLDKGVAYQAGDEVLFDISKYPNYGELSGRTLEDQQAGARVAVAAHKRNAGDFVLWKPAPADELGWDSPWGRGRPGWHLECSAMSYSHFGESFDIHGGGQDLLFPHHENERAQTCAAFGSNREMATFWLHNGYVLSEGKKMAKSEGNIVSAKELHPDLSREIVRWHLLSSHYKKPLDISKHSMKITGDEWMGLHNAVGFALANFTEKEAKKFWSKAEETPPDSQILDALCDDLNTPAVLARLRFLTKEIHKANQQKNLSDESLLNFLSSIRFLAVLPSDPEILSIMWAVYKRGDDMVTGKLRERNRARKENNWKLADKIRDELSKEKIQLEDREDGTQWTKTDGTGGFVPY